MRRSPPPIAIAAAPDAVRERWPAEHGLDDAHLRMLAAACADVTTDPAALVDSATDWWPRALRWARRGEVPARPAAVARPASVEEVSALVRVCTEQGIAV